MNSQKLLLVDSKDDTFNRLGKTLTQAGYEVITAASSNEALQISSDFLPDLVILNSQYYNRSDIDLTQKLFESGMLFIFMCSHEIDMLVAHQEQPDAILKSMPDIKSALKWAAEIRRLKETEKRYSKAIQTGRVVDVVIGILMERYHIKREKAFELLRQKARSERIQLRTLAQEMLDAQEKLNQIEP